MSSANDRLQRALRNYFSPARTRRFGAARSTAATTSRTAGDSVQSLIPFAQQPFLQVNVGDTLAGRLPGPLTTAVSGATWCRRPRWARRSRRIQWETTRAQRDNEPAVATYNVENLDPSDPADKFARLAQGIVTNLSSPDIVALEEIQDNTGATDDGAVAADQTLDLFTAAIVAGGPHEWRQIDPVDLADGGERR